MIHHFNKYLIIFLIYVLSNVLYGQITPYIKFQVTSNSDLFIAHNPETYTFVGNNDDTIKVISINIIDERFIELITNKRLEMNIGYALIYKRKINDLYIKTPYYTFFGFCPAFIQKINVNQPTRIN